MTAATDPAALTWTTGSVRITRIEENTIHNRAEDVFAGATTQALDRHRPWLGPFVDDDGKLIFSIHALLVEAGGHKIVVDTCVGSFTPPGFESMIVPGCAFLERLAAAGFDHGSVDYVVNTHLHFDHIGWNTILDGDQFVPTFPNARYIATRRERAELSAALAAIDPAAHGPYGCANSVVPLEEAGLLDLVDPGFQLTDEIWLEATPGHSPGQVALRIDSASQHALITGDVTHHPIQWAEPEWSAHADSDQQQSAATRRRMRREHADEPMLIIGTHYPPPSAGYVVTTPEGYRFVTEPGMLAGPL